MYQKFCQAIKNLQRGQKGITGLETAIILIAFVTVASVLAYSVLSAGIFSSERGKAAVYSGLESAQSTMSLKGSVVGLAGTASGATSYGSCSGTEIVGSPVDLNSTTMNIAVSAESYVTFVINAGCTAEFYLNGIHQLQIPAGSNEYYITGAATIRLDITAPGAAGSSALSSVTFNLALAIAGDSVDLNNLVINYWDSGMGVTALTLDTANSQDPTKKTTTAGEWSFYLSDSSKSSILKGTLEAVMTVAIPSGATVGSYNTFTLQINPPTGASITLQRTLPPIAAVMTLN